MVLYYWLETQEHVVNVCWRGSTMSDTVQAMVQ